VGLLLHHGTELAQHVQVVVDRPVPDPAAAQVGDERLTQPVQQRSAEQDRDPARAGVRIDVGDVRPLDVLRVQDQPALGGVLHHHPVQLEQAGHHHHVPDPGHVAQGARLLAEQGGDHRLGDEVLRAPDLDGAAQRGSTVHGQHIAHDHDRFPPV
jgi:hypothetical protein